MKNIFISGIDTDVGKTVCSAVVCKALNADYWKPIQSGDLENSDLLKLKQLLEETPTTFHEEAYRLNTPASPHYSAALEEITINLNEIQRPKTEKHLVIEGAGGLMVPLNAKEFIKDLIQPDDAVILVSKHYLGSINHSLLSLSQLQQMGHGKVGIIFMGASNPASEDIISNHPVAFPLKRIPWVDRVDASFITECAYSLKNSLKDFLKEV